MDSQPPQRLTRFAVVDEVRSPPFMSITSAIDELHVRHSLPDHSGLNQIRFPWSAEMLSDPAFYASRIWEYPFAVLAAGLKPGMAVADIGCGMTAFTVYLKEKAECDVTGVDPEVFEAGVKYFGHGVSHDFIRQTGLRIIEGGFEGLPLPTDSQDRVFCISVMEHVSPEIRRMGMQEIARILKPGGRAVLTVDMSIVLELNRPLDLVWDSGLIMVEPTDLRWPTRRFGMLSNPGEDHLPVDVLGMTLLKEGRTVETAYRVNSAAVECAAAHLVPTFIRPLPEPSARWRRIPARLRAEMQSRLHV